MLDLKSLENDYENEKNEIASAEFERRMLEERVTMLRAECSVLGISTLLVLANLTANVRGFPGNFSLNVDGSDGALHFSVDGKNWAMAETDFVNDLKEKSHLTTFSKMDAETLLEAVLSHLDMPGSAAVGNKLRPLIMLGHEGPGMTQLEALLERLPPWSADWAAEFAEKLADVFGAPDKEGFAARIRSWREKRPKDWKDGCTTPQSRKAKDGYEEVVTLWTDAGFDPDTLIDRIG